MEGDGVELGRRVVLRLGVRVGWEDRVCDMMKRWNGSEVWVGLYVLSAAYPEL